jgi:hypothetical protein
MTMIAVSGYTTGSGEVVPRGALTENDSEYVQLNPDQWEVHAHVDPKPYPGFVNGYGVFGY